VVTKFVWGQRPEVASTTSWPWGNRPHGVGTYDVESAVDIGLLELPHLHLHFHNA